MIHYLDTNVVIALLFREAQADRVRIFIDQPGRVLISSDFIRVEFASVTSKLVRMGALSVSNGRRILDEFDVWASRMTNLEVITGSDLERAGNYIRRLDLNLRAPDAINIAVAARIGATLVTFDKRMIECSRVLGVHAIEP